MWTKKQKAIYAKKWRAKNLEKSHLYHYRYSQKNKQKLTIINKKWRSKNKEKMKKYSREWKKEHQIAYRRKIREIVIEHYGGKCDCCGEERIEFLAIDHINGDGNKHRKKVGNRNMAEWLRQNNYPRGVRILCHNCNSSYGFYKYCPHEIERRKRV